jgi:hypothetical protein
MIPCWMRLPSRKDKRRRRSFTPLSEDGTQSLVQLRVVKLIPMLQQYLRSNARAGKNHLAHLPTLPPSSQALKDLRDSPQLIDLPIHRSPGHPTRNSPRLRVSVVDVVLDQLPDTKCSFFPITRSTDLQITRSTDLPITRSPDHSIRRSPDHPIRCSSVSLVVSWICF